MSNHCPLCGQTLPKGIHQHQLTARIQKLATPVVAAEKNKLRKEYDAQLTAEREMARQRAERQVQRELRDAQERAERAEQQKQNELKRVQKDYALRLSTERENARKQAEREVKRQLLDAEKRVKDAEARGKKEADQLRHEFKAQLEKEVARNTRLSLREHEAELQKLQAERERDKVRHEAESARLQGKLEDLSRKLEKQTGEQLGNEAELDLYTALTQAFPGDKIDRIGRGIKGADIVQQVMDGTKVAGRIIYESKNTLEWNKSFIAQAKKYQAQYETPHVMIVSRRFPPKQKGFCIVNGIPVVEPGMAICLATVIREAVIQIAKLRLSGSVRDGKSQELFDYVVSDRFATRFREIAESVALLRVQQLKERTWHENTWETESKLHERIDGRHREVGAQIQAIVQGASDRKAVSAKAGR
jgi:hypothetical protein